MTRLIKLETERLVVISLSLDNLRLLIEDKKSMEKNLGVKITGNELSPEMKDIFREPYEKAIKDEENYLWYTNWPVILKEDNRIIGGITFKGLPNDFGEVEVGYGIDEKYQNRGYMTEALDLLIKWALVQNNVKSVIAETDQDNLSSQRVLKKVGMEKYKETKGFYWYKKQ